MTARLVLLSLLLASATACGDDGSSVAPDEHEHGDGDGGDGDGDTGDGDTGDGDIGDGDGDTGDGDVGDGDGDTGDGDGDGDGDEDVVIRFVPKVGEEAFECGRSYADVGSPGREIEPVDFRFYVSDARLLKAGGGEVPIELDEDDLWQTAGVAMIDFEDGEGACNQGDAPTNVELRGTAPAGVYTGVKFTIGIPQALNHADLTTQASPLNKSSLFWGWSLGHIFFAAVSRTEIEIEDDAGIDDDGGVPGTGANEHFTHLGSTGCDGDPMAGEAVTTCTNPNRPQIVLADFDYENQEIVVDFAEVKRGSDVAANIGCHSFSPATCNAPYARLGLDFATGEPGTAAQSVFHVE